MTATAWKRLAPLLVLALAVRLGAAVWWQSRLPGRFAYPDSESYWSLGREIAAGQPYRFGPADDAVFRTPGYPLLLAPLFVAAGREPSVLWARAEAALLGTLAVAAVWWLALRLFDARAAMIAGAIAAFYPGAIVTSIIVLSEAPFCPLMVGQLALIAGAGAATEMRRATTLGTLAGLAGGAATLMRPSWLLFTPIVAIVVALAWRRGGQFTAHSSARRATGVAVGLAMVAGLVVAMLPWWIRNYAVTGRFVPTTLQVGASLYDGLNPQATGASNMDFVPRFVREESAWRDAAEPLEIRLDRRMWNEALAWARANPEQALRLAGVKVLRMWNIWPNEAGLSSWPIRLAVLGTYVPLMILGLIGAVRTRRDWRCWLCWLPTVYLTALHAVFVSSIRYREPAMLAVIVLASGVLREMARHE